MKRCVIFAVILFCLCAGCAARNEPFTKTLAGPLDTVSSVTVCGGGESASAAADEIFDALRDIDARMSACAPESELTRVAAGAPSPVTVSPDVFALLETALAVSRSSNGAFEPTIRPIVNLWGFTGENTRVPSDGEIETALRLVGFEQVILNPAERSVTLALTGMALDLGAIAKGYACDAAVLILKQHNINKAILDFGGNIYALGTKPDGSPWNVGVKTPIIGENDYFCVLRAADESIVTSGAYERFFEQDGKTYHHIFDPKTGRPVSNGLLSVTVVSKSSTLADALSTACFVMGLRAGFAYLCDYDGAEGVFVTDGMDVFITPGLAGKIRISDNRFRLAADP